MQDKDIKNIVKGLRNIYKPHPWHGIDLYAGQTGEINAYIEMVPSDAVKYEMDKETGYLKIDRPQRFSNQMPTLYGFIPKTYCGPMTANFCEQKTGRGGIVGDGDPLDICVITEKAISHGDIILKAHPIGGLRLIDRGEADDKIISIFSYDSIYSEWKDITDLPKKIIDRLRHYFLTYKDIPEEGKQRKCEIVGVYGREEALEVIKIASQDYANKFEIS